MRSASAYVLAALAVFAAAATIYFQPVVFSNEAAYLIPSRRLLDPTFLAQDWEVLVRSGSTIVSLLFDVLAVPFWWLFESPEFTALAFRTTLLFATVASLFLFIRALGVSPLPAAIGLIVWLYFGQSIAAGAWMIGGAEKKVLAYCFSLLSLTFLLRSRYPAAGLFAGLAVAAHVLVGAWLGLALFLTILATDRAVDRRLAAFCLAAAVPAAPVMIAAAVFAAGGSGTVEPYLGLSTAELVVAKRNPHHGDPFVFLNFRQSVEALAFFGAAFFAVYYSLSGRARSLMFAFLGALGVFWVVGLAARASGLWGFLLLFPFRIGDVFVPMVVAALGLAAAGSGVRQVWSAKGALRRSFAAAGLGALGLAALLFLDVAVSKAPRMLDRTMTNWQAETGRERGRLVHWIRENTATDAVFLAAPLDYGFKLETGRAVVASFKGAPANAAIHEWFPRMEALTGTSPIARSGYEMIDWAEVAYAQLPAERIVAAARRYGADYYLVDRLRPDLSRALLVSFGDWHLYAVSALATTGRSERRD